jgi:hypothetical protein
VARSQPSLALEPCVTCLPRRASAPNHQSAIPIINRQIPIANRQSVNWQSQVANPNRQSTIGNRRLLGLSMRDVLAAEAAVLAQLEPLAGLLLVLRRAVIPALTLGARQGNDVSHGNKSDA